MIYGGLFDYSLHSPSSSSGVASEVSLVDVERTKRKGLSSDSDKITIKKYRSSKKISVQSAKVHNLRNSCQTAVVRHTATAVRELKAGEATADGDVDVGVESPSRLQDV